MHRPVVPFLRRFPSKAAENGPVFFVFHRYTPSGHGEPNSMEALFCTPKICNVTAQHLYTYCICIFPAYIYVQLLTSCLLNRLLPHFSQRQRGVFTATHFETDLFGGSVDLQTHVLKSQALAPLQLFNFMMCQDYWFFWWLPAIWFLRLLAF